VGRAANGVVFVAGKDPETDIGGHWSYVRGCARAATRAGYRPRIFCLGTTAACWEEEWGTIERFRSPFPPFRAPTIPVNGPLLARAIVRAVGVRPGPWLLHGFGGWGWTAVAAAEALARRGIPAVSLVTSHTTLEDEYRAKWQGLNEAFGQGRRLLLMAEYALVRLLTERFERRSYERSNLVLVNYENVRRLIEARWTISRPIRRIPYAPEAAFFAAREPSPRSEGDPPLVVSISRHDPRKGIDRFLNALALLRKAGRRFRACLVGGGILLERDRALARSLGLDEVVEQPGFVPDVTSYLARADVYVLPSLQEGSGSLALLEALRAGLPIVASAVDGIPEDVAHEREALLVPPGNSPALAAAIARLLDDPGLRARLGAEGRRTFEREFSADVVAASLAKIYGELGFEADS
jgi:glycosyltransferase involved in cell wall biosynthesis